MENDQQYEDETSVGEDDHVECMEKVKDGRTSQEIDEVDVGSLVDGNETKRTQDKCQHSANINENNNQKGEKVEAEHASKENFTFDALEHTKVAVAQFAAAALSKGANESSIKDLTMLQSALFTLQHQQVFQMQLIEQLQYQLAKNSTRRDTKRTKPSQLKQKKEDTITEIKQQTNKDIHNSNYENDTNASKDQNETETIEQSEERESNTESNTESKTEEKLCLKLESTECNISSALASNIITNHDTNSQSDGTNSLQLLQKRAEEVLDSATQSFRTGNLIDELSYRTGAYFNDSPSDDPALKHRCRFCGKIFGSDSALQIHLRSHTGERPFECRVCGSRFTTKGNLKVHYQRHTETMALADDSKMDHRSGYDFRSQSKQPKIGQHLDRPFAEESFELSKKEEEEEKDDFNEVNEARSSQASESPRRIDDDAPRHFPNFDQEYSSSKKKEWEKYMEIVDTPKASELQQDEAYRVDPNKCPICNRLLSCRSALRQHYRTHTGERPFKCRLCARSFTTKGNLKTHIGVHKINPLLNPVHTCTICDKKYSTQHVLQQHMNTHTGAPIEMTLDQIRAAEVRDFVSSESIPDLYGSCSSLGDLSEIPDADHGKTTRATDFSDSEDSRSRSKRSAQDFEKEIEKMRKNFNYSGSPESKKKCSDSDKLNKSESPRGIDFFSKFSPMFGSSAGTMSTSSNILGGNFNSLMAANSFSPTGFPTGVRGNTTCNICFKTLACQSALEIHYRSHTKEKPYVCQLCNRGFSTKGNMKQHMLTHKIRDMPQHVFRNSTQSPSSDSNNSLSASGFQTQQHTESQPAESVRDDTDRQLKATDAKDNDFDRNASIAIDQSEPTYLSSDESGSMSLPIRKSSTKSTETNEISDVNDTIKRNTLPKASNIPSKIPTKENESNNETSRKPKTKDSKRDYCKICSKHFGSYSALETHMRSHTGAKPFVCPVCEKSFSTKGNLKVHMQAHSWPNDTNRTNQRMSLNMPNPFPQMNPYALHRPADLLNPFIASALQQKLHEANLYQKYVNASNMRELSADIRKNNDEQSVHRNLYGLAHLPFQMFNDHIDHGSMINK